MNLKMVFERELIKLVRERKCLYQTKSRSNTNNQQRLNEWHRVSAVLRKPVIECRQRWRSLRDRFVREKKKLELGYISSNCEQQWEYYNEMEFLIPSVKPRRSKREKSVQKGAKIYLNRELSDNFANISNISNSRDECSPAIAYESYSFDEMFDTETTTPQEFHDESKPNDATDEFMSDDDEDYEDQKLLIDKNASIAVQHTKDEEWIEDDFDKYPIIKISTTPTPNENENVFKTIENFPLTPRQTEKVTTTTTPTDPTETFCELMNSLKTEINKVLVEEKDENDLFLECMGKKMKKLSPRAKFKIQAKLLESITQELLKEIKE